MPDRWQSHSLREACLSPRSPSGPTRRSNRYELIAHEVPDVIVGAGTVINREQAQAACDAGAQFLVTPGMVEEVVAWAQENKIPILAGAVTPTEMIRGIQLGWTS